MNPEVVEYWDTHYKSEFQGDSPRTPYLKYISLFSGREVLEIGPGQGRQTWFLSHQSITSFYAIADISNTVLHDQLFHGMTKYLITDYSESLGRKFDVIHFWYVFHHMSFDLAPQFVDFLDRNLRNSGVLLFNLPQEGLPEDAYSQEGKGKTVPWTLEKVKQVFSSKFHIADVDYSQSCDSMSCTIMAFKRAKMGEFINLGCGASRPRDMRWVNIDSLYSLFPPGVPEREQLDSEPNYLDQDLRTGLPSVATDSVGGILASHFFEHLTPQESLALLRECYRVLRKGGVLRVSVPCPKKFLELQTHEDNGGGNPWGEENPEKHIKTFTEYALLFIGHKQICTPESMYVLFYLAGFREYEEKAFNVTWMPGLESQDNRPNFSAFIEARK